MPGQYHPADAGPQIARGRARRSGPCQPPCRPSNTSSAAAARAPFPLSPDSAVRAGRSLTAVCLQVSLIGRIADHDSLAHLIDGDVREIHRAQTHTPLLPGKPPVSLCQLGSFHSLVLICGVRNLAFEALRDVQGHGLMGLAGSGRGDPPALLSRPAKRGHDDREFAWFRDEPDP